ncbi:META domain-containing protein, partial [Synergistaceae bacterium OttesenSCG-928-I11]|nr:META domain-containing protein [Synergistaceae bacterium OttesenSCG-928-I11]
MKIKTTILLSLFLAILVFAGMAWANNLADTAWNVTGFNNGKQAVTSPIAGTEITAHFGEDGRLYGTSGCNDYTTSYSTDGNRISFRPAAATRKFCTLPDGVMQQESAYLDALESAATWQIRGDTLELFAKDGSLAVTMKSASRGGDTMLFRNGDREAIVELNGPDELSMNIDGKTYHMKQTISASGARYEATDDKGTVFWNKGDMATISIRGRDIPGEFTLVRNTRGDDELYITIDGETYRMKRVVSASGAKYEAVDDPTTVFWSKGRRASLTVRGEEYSKYVLIRNSPDEDELFLSVDGENFRLRRVPTASGAKYESRRDPSTYFWTKGDTATLYVRGKEYVGYDASAQTEASTGDATLPIGVEWTVQSIAGNPIVPGSTVTIRFDHNARLGGKASVNNYMSSWIATGDRLLVKGAASTMMAGPQNLMDQEHKFLAALENIRKYEIQGDTLILT